VTGVVSLEDASDACDLPLERVELAGAVTPVDE
jgi:hypothetical protein